MYYLLIDEIQFVEGFEKVLNGLTKIENLDVYVIGSNSKFLSTDILTEFRGRGDEVKVILQDKKLVVLENDIQKHLPSAFNKNAFYILSKSII